MRTAILSACLALFASALVTAPVAAQDEFDDEFGDEFGDDSHGQQQPANGGDATQSDDEFGDDFEGDLDEAHQEGGGAEEAAEPAAPAGAEDLAHAPPPRPSTLFGPVGGIHLVDASPNAAQSFRLQLVTDFFFQGDFLNVGD